MAGDNSTPNDLAQIMHGLGQLSGSVNALQTGLTARIEDIRSDIRRIEEAQTERLNAVERNLVGQINQLRDDMGKRVDGLGTRVTHLEQEDKRIIDKVARVSALGGGAGGGLVMGAVELIKHLAK